MNRSLSPLLASSLLTCLVGCIDYEVEKVDTEVGVGPKIDVSPQQLNFGAAEVGEEMVQTFIIESVGETTLDMRGVQLSGSGAFTLLSGAEARNIPVGRKVEVEVAFVASGADESGDAVVFSDDPTAPKVFVQLLGGVAAPQLTVDPTSIDFGEIQAGVEVSETVRLMSTGADTVTVSEFNFPDAPFGVNWAFGLPLELEPGESEDVEITYRPTAAGEFTGVAGFVSDDPSGVDEVALMGTADADAPVAICSVAPDPVDTLYEDATWYGSASYDPNGYRLIDYDWTLISKPSGSSASMPRGSSDRSGFVTDVAGIYIGRLVVTNELGVQSNACEVSLESIPSEDLWVEMYWTHNNDDMDLHLLAPGGSLTATTDCYFANCTGRRLDWGTRSDSSDDPSLDLDDIPGTGPENINIGSPQTGDFEVYVHDYPGSSYNGSNDVTVNIYIAGALVWSDTRDINMGEDHYEHYATVSWPSAIITSR